MIVYKLFELIEDIQNEGYKGDLPSLIADWLEMPSPLGATSDELGKELAELVFIWMKEEEL